MRDINTGLVSRYLEKLREYVRKRQKMLNWREQNIKLDNGQFINMGTLSRYGF